MPPVETITVLMTDLVGSTGLETRLGPAAADELRREHFGLLRDAIGACAGDEVKTTGDGLMVVFRGAANAVRCAVGIQQGVERRNRRAEHPLTIRVGVSLGDATREGDDYFGLPVVEASRLCERADGGQLLTTELVWRIGGRDAPPFEPVGALELKGLPEPTPAYEIAWEPEPHWAHDLPLPPRLRVPSTVGYVGRVRERARAAELWEDAIAGRRQALLVAGEPGIGKTRFTIQVALELHAAGAVVLFGHCAGELGAPYGAFIEAVSHLVEHAPDEALVAHVERHGGELGSSRPAAPRSGRARAGGDRS
jgi:class 3 adenylate cyclase